MEPGAAHDPDAVDTQQVEILGRNRLKTSLIEAGIEVATPERDNGIDLIAYVWSAEQGTFLARPIQMKAASNFSFAIDRKYERIPTLLMAFVMGLRQPQHSIFVMTYDVVLSIATTLGWTETASWQKANAYSTRHASKRLGELLAPHTASPAVWQGFFTIGGSDVPAASGGG
jgi:hypothetical protein